MSMKLESPSPLDFEMYAYANMYSSEDDFTIVGEYTSYEYFLFSYRLCLCTCVLCVTINKCYCPLSLVACL